jgi:hypothetical protein
MPDYTQLIPELKQWNTDIESWIAAVGRFDHAIAYGQIFWPQFRIHDDCVLFANCPDTAFDHWMQHTTGDRTAVEAVLNHRHILDLFTSSEFEPSEEAVVHLGRLMREMWSCKLARDFPGRTIVVSFEEEVGDDMLDYQITFYHKR